MDIRLARPDDVPAITRIINHWIACDTAIFYTTPRPEAEIAAQFQQAGERYPWLVGCASEDTARAADSGIGGGAGKATPRLMGAAWSKPWSPREAYAGTVEVSVYIAPEATGQGVGSRLYETLIPMLDGLGYHTILAGITLPNPASVRLHEKLGFVKVAHFREVGNKFEQWLDVGYWQRMPR